MASSRSDERRVDRRKDGASGGSSGAADAVGNNNGERVNGQSDDVAGGSSRATCAGGSDPKFVNDVLIPSLNATAALASSNLSGVTLALIAQEKALKEKQEEVAKLLALKARLQAETDAMEQALRPRPSLEERLSKYG